MFGFDSSRLWSSLGYSTPQQLPAVIPTDDTDAKLLESIEREEEKARNTNVDEDVPDLPQMLADKAKDFDMVSQNNLSPIQNPRLRSASEFELDQDLIKHVSPQPSTLQSVTRTASKVVRVPLAVAGSVAGAVVKTAFKRKAADNRRVDSIDKASLSHLKESQLTEIPKLYNDREYMLKQISLDERAFNYVDHKLKHDPEFKKGLKALPILREIEAEGGERFLNFYAKLLDTYAPIAFSNDEERLKAVEALKAAKAKGEELSDEEFLTEYSKELETPVRKSAVRFLNEISEAPEKTKELRERSDARLVKAQLRDREIWLKQNPPASITGATVTKEEEELFRQLNQVENLPDPRKEWLKRNPVSGAVTPKPITKEAWLERRAEYLKQQAIDPK